jgi:predicted  nucleic acid-binding Zn-ribbon protein
MADNKFYISLTRLAQYDAKIKALLEAGDAASLAQAKAYAESLASNYDVAGSAASAQEAAKNYTDAEVKKATDAAAAAQAQADKGVADAATADGKAVAAQGAVDALGTYVGTIPEAAEATDIVGYIQEKTSGIATDTALSELTDRVSKNETDIGNITKDYLKAADKTELEGKITDVTTAVNTEKSRAEGVEAGLEARLAAVEGDYLTSEDKDEIQGKIDQVNGAIEVLTEGVDTEKVDGVKDLIAYVEEHGPEVTGMKQDIAKNAEDVAGVAGRMTTAEGKITAVEQAVATKAEQTALDQAVQTLSQADQGLAGRIEELEGKFGEEDGSVASMIATAKQEAIDAAAGDATTKANAAESAAKTHADGLNTAMTQRVDGLAAESATHAKQADLEALAGRVTTAEGEIDTLQTEMDAVEALAAANKAAHEANAAAIALKASQADLEALTGRVAKNEADIAAFVEASEQDINNLFNKTSA